MSELATLARPYAEAVFKHAKQTGTAEQWSNNLKFLAIAMEDRELAAAADNPRVAKSRVSDFLLEIGQGYLSDEGRNFVRLLVANNRLNLVSDVQSLFEAYRALDEGYIEAEVRTAFPLNKDAEKQLAKTLENVLKRKVHFRVEEDKSLIGGVVIRAGDTVIDASVSGQLQKLAKRLYS
ncbi:MAG: F0F1 ATP synthase subunit delta [Methylococcaceae bacterium]|nr:F0F1 ATP synthase subunit delta [Methylococcaceae bacterium]MCI0733836.1 F0F1 ATP synthase subunit delta [Methylococcaceae bacterium]